MIVHKVRVHASAEPLPREHQLAWKIAEVAASTRALDEDVVEMIRCRIVDNAAVALAAVNRAPAAAARAMALAHPRRGGATLYGLPPSVRLDGAARACRLVENDRICAIGVAEREAVADGYRDGALVLVLRGRPGAPVRLKRISASR